MLKHTLVRRGQGDNLARLNAAYTHIKRTQDVELEDESHLIYCGYPSRRDVATLATTICDGSTNWDSLAQQLMLRKKAPFVDAHFVMLFAAWMIVNDIEGVIDLDEDLAMAWLKTAWSHAPSHALTAEKLHDAFKCTVRFDGTWETEKLGGAATTQSKSVRDMVRGMSYAGEPVYDALSRMKDQLYETHEKRCVALLREECFRT